MTISAVILTRNEEANIRACIESLAFCDEILVVDDNSTDQTVKIAQHLGAKVFKRDLNGDFASQRNFGFKKAKSEWALFVDADERVPENLKEEIIQSISDRDSEEAGFFIKRSDYIWGKFLKYGETGGAKFLRLIRRGKGRWVRKVHEFLDVDGPTFDLSNSIIHYPHQTLREFIDSINTFSTIHAKENFKEGKKTLILRIVFWPPAKFISSYILKLGIFDGGQGFIMAAVMSFHSFLAWSKLWMTQKARKYPSG